MKSSISQYWFVLIALVFSCVPNKEEEGMPDPEICIQVEDESIPWLINQEIKFTNCSTHFDSVLWDFGDGITSIELNPTHRYKEKGEYEVTLTIKGAGGEETSTHKITVLEPARLKIVAGNGQSGPPGETLEDPIVVSVTNLNDQPLEGVIIKFSPEEITNTSLVSTDSQGLAETDWILADRLGNHSLTASIEESQFLYFKDSVVTFEAFEILFYMSLDINGKNHYYDKTQGDDGYTRHRFYSFLDSGRENIILESNFYCEYEPFIHGVFIQFATREGCPPFKLEESTYQFGMGENCSYAKSTSGVGFWAGPYLYDEPCNEAGGFVSYALDTKGSITFTKVTDKFAEGTFSFTQTHEGVLYEVTNGHFRAPICPFVLGCY